MMMMDATLTSPRALTPPELSQLRTILKSCLKLIDNEEEEEDAESLLEYAFDMIDSVETVGHIAEEVRLLILIYNAPRVS